MSVFLLTTCHLFARRATVCDVLKVSVFLWGLIFFSFLRMLLRKAEFLCCRLEEGKLRTVPRSPDTKAPGPPQLINRCVLVPSQAQPLMAKQGPNNCEELKAKYWLYLLSNKRAMKLI